MSVMNMYILLAYFKCLYCVIFLSLHTCKFWKNQLYLRILNSLRLYAANVLGALNCVESQSCRVCVRCTMTAHSASH